MGLVRVKVIVKVKDMGRRGRVVVVMRSGIDDDEVEVEIEWWLRRRCVKVVAEKNGSLEPQKGSTS